MSVDWLAVFEALKKVYIEEGFSNLVINEAVSKHKGCRDSFVRTFAKGVIRDTIRLDFIIEKMADKGLKGIKNRTLIVLRMGIYAIDSMNSIPNHAAVNEAVALSKKVSKGTDRFINAILRNYIREKDSIIFPENLFIEYSYHPTITALFEKQYGEEAEKILSAMNMASPLILRTNTTKITSQELLQKLSEDGISAESVEGPYNAIKTNGGDVIGSSLYREGYFTVQSLSSIQAIEAFSPKEGSTVLDLCSAPGGKATAIAEIMNDNGKILACDIYPHRLELIDASAERLGLTSIKTEISDGTKLREDFVGKFDYVLADVPCSGLGTCASKPEIKLRPIEGYNSDLRKTQISILENAFEYAKEGGFVEYSTCTLNKEENESIIKEYIKTASFARIVEIKTILPYNNSVGFFYAIMQKTPHNQLNGD